MGVGTEPIKNQVIFLYNVSMKGKLKFSYPGVRERARELRKNQTEAEKILWEAIRYKRLGFRFRRQHVIGRFIVDFYCMQVNVAVEVDGDIHKQQMDYDQARQDWLKDSGVKVIRFSNERVMNDLPGVLNKIMDVCEGKR